MVIVKGDCLSTDGFREESSIIATTIVSDVEWGSRSLTVLHVSIDIFLCAKDVEVWVHGQRNFLE